MLNCLEENMHLNVKQAYRTMVDFLDGYYWNTKNDTLAGMLGFMNTELCGDGMPADTAVWSTWNECVDAITDDHALSSDNAFQAMVRFLEKYDLNFGFDLKWLLSELNVSPSTMEKWGESVAKALKNR